MPQNITSVIPRKALIVGFLFKKFECCRPSIGFSKKLHHGFFWSLANFSGHKEQILVNCSENIKEKSKAGSTEEGWRNRCCNGTAKENKVNYFENFMLTFSRYSE